MGEASPRVPGRPQQEPPRALPPALGGGIRVSAPEAGGAARCGGKGARGADYLSGAGPWEAGGGPGGPGAPGGSHNADIPEPEPEPEAGAAERSGACALARAPPRASGDQASPEKPSGGCRGPAHVGSAAVPCSLLLFLFSKGPWTHRRFDWFFLKPHTQSVPFKKFLKKKKYKKRSAGKHFYSRNSEHVKRNERREGKGGTRKRDGKKEDKICKRKERREKQPEINWASSQPRRGGPAVLPGSAA